MTIVFVHGNPETDAVWNRLAERLADLGHTDQVRLSPPGFGAPLPEGFACTPAGYRHWLVERLETFAEPVDLVGHDLGGGHVVGVAITCPDLLRTWCADVLGAFHEDYVWHDVAQLWQRSPDGEQWMAANLARTPEQRARPLAGLGMDPGVAETVAAGFDRDMATAVLAYYRAAAQPSLAETGRALGAARQRPGLAVVATEDHMVGTEEQHRACAGRAGAAVEVLPGLGHWWMTQDDGRAGAAALHGFWSAHRSG